MITLSNLRPEEGSPKARQRIGRGPGSGRGGTSTRGHKGGQSRSGYSRKPGFEGGQMPLKNRVPKFGFKSLNRVEYAPLNLDMIQSFVESYQTSQINLEFLMEHGFVSNAKTKVKLLGRGEIKSSVQISVHACSESAKAAIEQAGGSVHLIGS
jgi:large subunit ribosomal protein L15